MMGALAVDLLVAGKRSRVVGYRHGEFVDFDINDEELAYIVTAKIFALTAYRFLKGGAAAARKLVNDYKPIFTKQEYIDFMESMISTKIGGEPYFSTEI